MDVTSVEINPFVVDLCKKNTAINSLDDETRVLEGSLYSPLRDDSCFSLVVVNPPLLPIPDEIPYPSFEMEDNRVWIKHFVFLRVAIRI